jgi:hypothetical protein
MGGVVDGDSVVSLQSTRAVNIVASLETPLLAFRNTHDHCLWEKPCEGRTFFPNETSLACLPDFRGWINVEMGRVLQQG